MQPQFLSLLRPWQWTKNLVCFAGVLFAGLAHDPQALLQAGFAFLAFCAASSAAYVLNDYIDRERDREHPVKKHRPIASGRVSPAVAALLGAICLVAAFLLALPLPASVSVLIVLYLLVSVLYSTVFRHRVLLDVMFIAAGFILRILAGTEAVQVPASSWILLCAFFLALFLGFGKRRAEMNLMGDNIEDTRRVLRRYSVAMLDRFCNISATLTMAAYALFTVTSPNDHSLVITLPPVVYGIFRYLYLVERRDLGEAPDVILLKDLQIQLTILVWLALYISVLYFQLHLNIT